MRTVFLQYYFDVCSVCGATFQGAQRVAQTNKGRKIGLSRRARCGACDRIIRQQRRRAR